MEFNEEAIEGIKQLVWWRAMKKGWGKVIESDRNLRRLELVNDLDWMKSKTSVFEETRLF